jgi:hypothetical protein
LLGQAHLGLSTTTLPIIKKQAQLVLDKVDDLSAIKLSNDGKKLAICGHFRF